MDLLIWKHYHNVGKFRNKVVKIILTKEDLMARKINEFCFLNHHQHSEKKNSSKLAESDTPPKSNI